MVSLGYCARIGARSILFFGFFSGPPMRRESPLTRRARFLVFAYVLVRSNGLASILERLRTILASCVHPFCDPAMKPHIKLARGTAAIFSHARLHL